jgi:periplasmic protein TonB
MGYQALLFSPDEKLGRIVSQVFTELDFTVEPAYEPFGAVKKLMAQHFDAIVVDCDNEQNAALLFKSARNSSFNQSSLAIAVVEGQAGVAKAYRIGANLVLTKPINVEQAKGTLRVARGLLRKNTETAGGSAAGGADSAVPTGARPSAAPSQPASRGTATFTPPQSRPDLLEFETAHAAGIPDKPSYRTPAGLPPAVSAMTAPAKVEDKPAVPVPGTQIRITMDEPEPPVLQSRNLAIPTDTARNDSARTVSAPRAAQDNAAITASRSAAAAPARAKEVTAPAKEDEKVESKPANRSQDADPMVTQDFAIESAPLFSAFGGEEDSGAVDGKKKILIAAIVLFAFAALGYFGYTKLGTSGTATLPPPPVNTAQQAVAQNTSAQNTTGQNSAVENNDQPAPAPAPMSSPETVPSPGTADRAGSAIQPSAPKTITASKLPDLPTPAAGNPSVIRIALNPGAAAKNPDSAPLLVKSNPAAVKTQSPSPESVTPTLNPPTIASANDNALSSLMSSVPATLPKASLATTRISQGVSQGLLIKRVQPKYPQAALSAHAQGTVQIEATIDKEGKVTNLKVLSGHPILARSALEAVRQWRYKPYYLDGEPVEIETQITVNFKAE